MRKSILYIAMSLDGKIADDTGSVGWLDEIPNPDNNDYGYEALQQSIDTTIMGNSTYQQVLGFPVPFPYADKKNYVLTRDASKTKDEHATYISDNYEKFLRDLKTRQGKDIWLIGGGVANTLLHNLNLIDEYMVFVMPLVLGSGVDLFANAPARKSLVLKRSLAYPSGVTLLHYTTSE